MPLSPATTRASSAIPGRMYVRTGGVGALRGSDAGRDQCGLMRGGACLAEHGQVGVQPAVCPRPSQLSHHRLTLRVAAMADLDAELALFQAELGALTDDTPAAEPSSQPTVRTAIVADLSGRAAGPQPTVVHRVHAAPTSRACRVPSPIALLAARRDLDRSPGLLSLGCWLTGVRRGLYGPSIHHSTYLRSGRRPDGG